MGKLYREFFYVPKYGKINDKVMTVRVMLSAFVIIACLTALSLSAYAWFSFSVASGTNTIKTADFDITVSIPSAEPEEGVYSLANGEYSVLLTKTGNAKTGFCIVEIAVGEAKTTFHTQQLGKDEGVERGELTFTVQVSGLSEPATVSFTPHWGTSSYYSDNESPLYITDASTVSVTADGAGPLEEEKGSPTEGTETSSDPEQTERIHTVVEGENLTWIANDYNTTAQAIADYNGLEDMRTLQIGQQLKIPPAATESE